jgi:hypothetical protein
LPPQNGTFFLRILPGQFPQTVVALLALILYPPHVYICACVCVLVVLLPSAISWYMLIVAKTSGLPTALRGPENLAVEREVGGDKKTRLLANIPELAQIRQIRRESGGHPLSVWAVVNRIVCQRQRRKQNWT